MVILKWLEWGKTQNMGPMEEMFNMVSNDGSNVYRCCILMFVTACSGASITCVCQENVCELKCWLIICAFM